MGGGYGSGAQNVSYNQQQNQNQVDSYALNNMHNVPAQKNKDNFAADEIKPNSQFTAMRSNNPETVSNSDKIKSSKQGE